jgi:hypothetical protein
VNSYIRTALTAGLGMALCVMMSSCGGGGDSLGSSSGSSSSSSVTAAGNVANVTVSSGPNGNALNVLYTSVQVCLPGTSTCQTIDNIQVDTGSYGLRILAPVLNLTFPVVTLSSGAALLECTSFVDGYSWGPVTLADVTISGESASSVPVQIIGDSRYPTVPQDCSSSAPTEEDTVATFGANGILGIGPFASDCGEYCTETVPEPIIYYSCTTESSCTGTVVPEASQVPNPVTLFATDNNGSILTLSSAPSAGITTLTGQLIFGIDTESNNASGTETVVPIATTGNYAGYLSTTFNGTTLPQSFVDSGSNAYFFPDSSLSVCTGSGFSGFYCPSSTTSLSGEFALASGTSTVDFDVASAEQINAAYFVYPGLAGTNSASNSFDWGLPFFFGRRVLNAIQGYTTSAGTGPYIAY